MKNRGKNNKNRTNRQLVRRNGGGNSTRNYTSKESYSLTGLDPHKYMVMKYEIDSTLTATLNTAVSQTMNLNSLFDPDRTGTGHQPYTFDQMAVFYNRYRVLKTHVKIQVGTGVGSVNVLVLPLNGAPSAITTTSTFETAAENPRAVSSILGGQGAPSFGYNRMIDLKSLNGVTRVEYLADDRFEAQVSTSPSEVMTITLAILNNTVATVTVPYKITMFFYVDLHDLISVGGS